MATEKRMISLDEAINATHEEVFWTESEAAAVRSFLAKRPKVDAVEVVHGRWTKGFSVRCSVCNGYAPMDEDHDAWITRYCPNCGAKMDGDVNDQSDNLL